MPKRKRESNHPSARERSGASRPARTAYEDINNLVSSPGYYAVLTDVDTMKSDSEESCNFSFSCVARAWIDEYFYPRLMQTRSGRRLRTRLDKDSFEAAFPRLTPAERMIFFRCFSTFVEETIDADAPVSLFNLIVDKNHPAAQELLSGRAGWYVLELAELGEEGGPSDPDPAFGLPGEHQEWGSDPFAGDFYGPWLPRKIVRLRPVEEDLPHDRINHACLRALHFPQPNPVDALGDEVEVPEDDPGAESENEEEDGWNYDEMNQGGDGEDTEEDDGREEGKKRTDGGGGDMVDEGGERAATPMRDEEEEEDDDYAGYRDSDGDDDDDLLWMSDAEEDTDTEDEDEDEDDGAEEGDADATPMDASPDASERSAISPPDRLRDGVSALDRRVRAFLERLSALGRRVSAFFEGFPWATHGPSLALAGAPSMLIAPERGATSASASYYIGGGGEPNPLAAPGPRQPFVGMVNIGQGNFNVLYDHNGRGSMVYDLGRAYSKHEGPHPPTHPCLCEAGLVLLSHWDRDHCMFGINLPTAHYARWLAPQQHMGTNEVKELLGLVLRAGGRVYLYCAGGFRSLQGTHAPAGDPGGSHLRFPWGFVERSREKNPFTDDANARNNGGLITYVCVADAADTGAPAPARHSTNMSVAPPNEEPGIAELYIKPSNRVWKPAGNIGLDNKKKKYILTPGSGPWPWQQQIASGAARAATRPAMERWVRACVRAATPALAATEMDAIALAVSHAHAGSTSQRRAAVAVAAAAALLHDAVAEKIGRMAPLCIDCSDGNRAQPLSAVGDAAAEHHLETLCRAARGQADPLAPVLAHALVTNNPLHPIAVSAATRAAFDPRARAVQAAAASIRAQCTALDLGVTTAIACAAVLAADRAGPQHLKAAAAVAAAAAALAPAAYDEIARHAARVLPLPQANVDDALETLSDATAKNEVAYFSNLARAAQTLTAVRGDAKLTTKPGYSDAVRWGARAAIAALGSIAHSDGLTLSPSGDAAAARAIDATAGVLARAFATPPIPDFRAFVAAVAGGVAMSARTSAEAVCTAAAAAAIDPAGLAAQANQIVRDAHDVWTGVKNTPPQPRHVAALCAVAAHLRAQRLPLVPLAATLAHTDVSGHADRTLAIGCAVPAAIAAMTALKLNAPPRVDSDARRGNSFTTAVRAAMMQLGLGQGPATEIATACRAAYEHTDDPVRVRAIGAAVAALLALQAGGASSPPATCELMGQLAAIAIEAERANAGRAAAVLASLANPHGAELGAAAVCSAGATDDHVGTAVQALSAIGAVGDGTVLRAALAATLAAARALDGPPPNDAIARAVDAVAGCLSPSPVARPVAESTARVAFVAPFPADAARAIAAAAGAAAVDPAQSAQIALEAYAAIASPGRASVVALRATAQEAAQGVEADCAFAVAGAAPVIGDPTRENAVLIATPAAVAAACAARRFIAPSPATNQNRLAGIRDGVELALARLAPAGYAHCAIVLEAAVASVWQPGAKASALATSSALVAVVQELQTGAAVSPDDARLAAQAALLAWRELRAGRSTKHALDGLVPPLAARLQSALTRLSPLCPANDDLASVLSRIASAVALPELQVVATAAAAALAAHGALAIATPDSIAVSAARAARVNHPIIITVAIADPIPPPLPGAAPFDRANERFVLLTGDVNYDYIPAQNHPVGGGAPGGPPHLVGLAATHHGSYQVGGDDLDEAFIPWAPGTVEARMATAVKLNKAIGTTSADQLTVAGIVVMAAPAVAPAVAAAIANAAERVAQTTHAAGTLDRRAVAVAATAAAQQPAAVDAIVLYAQRVKNAAASLLAANGAAAAMAQAKHELCGAAVAARAASDDNTALLAAAGTAPAALQGAILAGTRAAAALRRDQVDIDKWTIPRDAAYSLALADRPKVDPTLFAIFIAAVAANDAEFNGAAKKKIAQVGKAVAAALKGNQPATDINNDASVGMYPNIQANLVTAVSGMTAPLLARVQKRLNDNKVLAPPFELEIAVEEACRAIGGGVDRIVVLDAVMSASVRALGRRTDDLLDFEIAAVSAAFEWNGTAERAVRLHGIIDAVNNDRAPTVEGLWNLPPADKIGYSFGVHSVNRSHGYFSQSKFDGHPNAVAIRLYEERGWRGRMNTEPLTRTSLQANDANAGWLALGLENDPGAGYVGTFRSGPAPKSKPPRVIAVDACPRCNGVDELFRG